MKQRYLSLLTLLTGIFFGAPTMPAYGQSSCSDLLNFSYKKLNSTESVNMCEAFKDKVVLVVNTASQCGFTPQFTQLEKLYQQYKDKGFTVVGFPSNDFYQERGSEAETAKVCHINYGVTFPMMEKVNVRGGEGIFQQLAATSGVTPKWNFYKYLIDREGKVIGVFPSNSEPMSSSFQRVVAQAL